MNELIEKLLQPVSPEKPCGPDLSYDPLFEGLETIAKGKPEVEIGNISRPAEPPEWGELRQKSTEFLIQSKHLRVAVFLACSMLKTGGLPAFRDGVVLIQGLLEKYWADLYPLLDPEDNNDPTQRLNILSALTAGRGGSGWITIQEYLHTVPLFGMKGAPPFTYDQILAARLGPATTPEGAAPTGPQLPAITAALQSVPDLVKDAAAILTELIEAVDGIDKHLTATLSASNTISFEPLHKLLREMSSTVQGFVPGAATEAASAEAPGMPAAVAAGAPSGGPAGGSIRGPDDVVRELERICAYYRAVEPGSPVFFILRRAQKLAKMDFLEAMTELNLAPTESLRPILGSVLDSANPPPPAS